MGGGRKKRRRRKSGRRGAGEEEGKRREEKESTPKREEVMHSFQATSALRLLILESFFSFIELFIEVNHVVMGNVWALFNRDINEGWD